MSETQNADTRHDANAEKESGAGHDSSSIPSLAQVREALELALESLPPDADVTFRSMFGGMGASARGRMFASLSNIGLALKLPDDAQAELLHLPGAARLQYEPDAPVSKTYIVVPAAMMRDTARLSAWAIRSVNYVLTLPAPVKKSRKKPAAE